jgi:hypothetical protein
MLAINRESDDRGDKFINIGQVINKAIIDGQFWIKFINVIDIERVRL